MSSGRSPGNTEGSLHPTRQQLDELDALLRQMLDLPVNRIEERAPAGPTKPVSSEPIREKAEIPARPSQREPMNQTARTTAEETDNAPLAVQPPHRLRKRMPPPTEQEAAAPTGDWVPFRSSWEPSPHTWPPLAESWAQAQKVPDQGRLRRDEPAVEAGHGEAALERRPVPSLAQPETPSETLIYPRPLFGTATAERLSPQSVPESRSRRETPAAEPSVGSTEEVFWLVQPVVWTNRVFEALVGWAGPPGQWLAGPGGKKLLGAVGVLCLIGAAGMIVADWLGWTL